MSENSRLTKFLLRRPIAKDSRLVEDFIDAVDENNIFNVPKTPVKTMKSRNFVKSPLKAVSSPVPEDVSMFVCGLDRTITEYDLEDFILSQLPDLHIKSIKIPPTRNKLENNKGYGFVIFATSREAEKLKALDGVVWNGRRLSVSK